MYNFIDRVQLYPFLDAKNNRKVVNLGKRKKKEKKKKLERFRMTEGSARGRLTKFSPEETTTSRSRDNKLPGSEVRAFAKITLQL